MRRLVILAGLTTALLAASALPAAAAEPGPWSPTRSSSFVAAAGTRCPFTLKGDVLSDHEQIRTLETFPDGTPRLQEVVGQLIMRFTNVDSGASVVRNLTGTGTFETFPDGSFTLSLMGGHFAAGLGPHDAGGPAYLYFTGTGYAIHIAADGSRTITRGNGQVENICTTLAG